MQLRIPLLERVFHRASARIQAARTPKTSKWKIALIILLSLVGVIVLALTAALIWVSRTESGRMALGEFFETSISDQIAGSMTVGSVPHVSWNDVHATNVRFLDANGQEVIHAHDFHMDIDWFAMLGGRFIVAEASARGGRVFLRSDRRGNLALEETFRAPGTTDSDDQNGKKPIEFAQLDVSNVDVLVRMDGVPNVTIHNVRTRMHVWVSRPGGKVRMTAANVRGRADVATPAPFTLLMQRGTVSYDGESARRADADVRGELSGADARMVTHVRVRNEQPHIDTTLHLENVGGWLQNAPLILQASIGEMMTDAFEFKVEVGD